MDRIMTGGGDEHDLGDMVGSLEFWLHRHMADPQGRGPHDVGLALHCSANEHFQNQIIFIRRKHVESANSGFNLNRYNYGQ